LLRKPVGVAPVSTGRIQPDVFRVRTRLRRAAPEHDRAIPGIFFADRFKKTGLIRPSRIQNAYYKGMATIIDGAARYPTERSIRAYKRMFLTTMGVFGVLTFYQGMIVSSLCLNRAHLDFDFFATEAVILLIAFLACRHQVRRMNEYERERTAWRKGSLGEYAVAAELAALPSSFFVMNDFRTPFGNIDHLVVGPTGIFAIETKNWRGVITADGQGELLANARPTSQPTVRRFFRRIMTVRDQMTALTHRDLTIEGILVFPKARLDMPLGATQNVHCVTDDWLCKCIEDPTLSKALSRPDVWRLVQAFKHVAGKKPEFSTTSLPQPAFATGVAATS